MDKLLDLYTDYLISSFSQTTATTLSKLTDKLISHDQISRFLNDSTFSSKDLWQSVKPLVRKHQDENACLIFDDSIIAKPHSDENDLISWHWDHSQKRSIKGINLLTAFYYSHQAGESEALRVPVAFELILKTVHFSDLKTKKQKRKCPKTKNEMMRDMIKQAISNGLKFKYVLADTWFASSDNMRFIHKKKKFFIFDLKSNRLAALTEKDRNNGHWTRIDELIILDNVPTKVWLKDLEFPILLYKQIFKNKDKSVGIRFLISNDFSLLNDDFATLYKKRWSVEEYHKSLKQNTAIAKSPTRVVKTQNNHVFASILAYIKLEKLKFANKMNHFAIKSKIYIAALKTAFKELNNLKQNLTTA